MFAPLTRQRDFLPDTVQFMRVTTVTDRNSDIIVPLWTSGTVLSCFSVPPHAGEYSPKDLRGCSSYILNLPYTCTFFFSRSVLAEIDIVVKSSYSGLLESPVPSAAPKKVGLPFLCMCPRHSGLGQFSVLWVSLLNWMMFNEKKIIILCILFFWNFFHDPLSYLESEVLMSSLVPN